MVDETPSNDPWSTAGLPFTRLWPVYAGIVGGLVLGLIWLALDQPSISFLPILVIGGVLVGGAAAALAPAGERSARFLDIAYPALLAGVGSRFFGAIGVVALGDDVGGEALNTMYVYFFVMVFFIGFPMLVAKVFQNPKRRLPDDVLAQIGEPYPTRRAPRLVTIRAEDGTTHRVSVLRGGFLAGIALPFDPTTAKGVAGDGTVPSGPKQIRASRAAAREDAQAKVVARRKAKADAKAAKGSSGDVPDDDVAGRAAPAPTSRTTPKGTPSKRKGSKR